MVEWFVFCGILYFNNVVVFSYYDVYVGFCGGIFNIFQIVDCFVVNDVYGNCCYYVFYWIGFQFIVGN